MFNLFIQGEMLRAKFCVFALLSFRRFRVFGIVVVVVVDDERGFSRKTFPQSTFVARDFP